MLDSKIDPDEWEEIPEGMTEEEYEEALEQSEINRQMDKYNL